MSCAWLSGKQPVLCWEMNGRIASECCPSDTYQPASFSSVKMTYCQVKRSCNFRELFLYLSQSRLLLKQKHSDIQLKINSISCLKVL